MGALRDQTSANLCSADVAQLVRDGATLDIVQAIYAETTSTNSQKDAARI